MQIAEVGVLEDHHSDGVVQGRKLSLPHQHPHSNPFLTSSGLSPPPLVPPGQARFALIKAASAPGRPEEEHS